MPLLAPVVDVWTMREAIVRAELGTNADVQNLDPYDLEDLWRWLWQSNRTVCSEAMKAYHFGKLRKD